MSRTICSDFIESCCTKERRRRDAELWSSSKVRAFGTNADLSILHDLSNCTSSASLALPRMPNANGIHNFSCYVTLPILTELETLILA